MAIAVGVADRALQAFEAQVAERVRADEVGNLFDAEVRADQLFARRRVDAIEAGRDGRRTTDADVDFARAGPPHYLPDLLRGRAAHDRIVNQPDPLPFDQVAHGIELHLDAEVAYGLFRLDEGAPDVVVAHQAEAELRARL